MPKTRIGIQGDIGSANERAAKYFAQKNGWKNFEIKYLISTENVLKALNNNEIHFGTFAYESSREGLVEETQKAIKKYSFQKIDEQTFQLDHALLQNKKIYESKPITIYSHPQALKEHKSFLTKRFQNLKLIKEIDTALAAKKLKNNEYPQNSLVIAPISCAEIYNLKIYLPDLPTNKGYLTKIYLVKKSHMHANILQNYQKAQQIAKDTINFLKEYLCEGISEKEIKKIAEEYMIKKGSTSFWYHNVGAFILVGERTTISLSGKNYKPTDTKIQKNDLVTIDLSPTIKDFWADFARSFIIENGKVTETEKSNQQELVEGIKTEEKLHQEFQKSINPNTTFHEIFKTINNLIENLGYKNLDFKKNLGHSIEKHRDNRIYIEENNHKKLQETNFFTFEPHIKKKNGKYGFKMENIYYFEKEKLHIL